MLGQRVAAEIPGMDMHPLQYCSVAVAVAGTVRERDREERPTSFFLPYNSNAIPTGRRDRMNNPWTMDTMVHTSLNFSSL